jgi:hypothetical protein
MVKVIVFLAPIWIPIVGTLWHLWIEDKGYSCGTNDPSR